MASTPHDIWLNICEVYLKILERSILEKRPLRPIAETTAHAKAQTQNIATQVGERPQVRDVGTWQERPKTKDATTQTELGLYSHWVEQVRATPRKREASTQAGNECEPPASRPRKDVPARQIPPTEKEARRMSVPFALSHRKCYNCGKSGHTYAYCFYSQKRVFCYGCGVPGVTLRSCSRCEV